MKFKINNWQALLESIFSFILSTLLCYLVISEKYLLYVTPRIKVYIYFTAAVFFLISFFSLSKVKYVNKKFNLYNFTILLVPIFFLSISFTFKGSILSKSNYSNNNSLVFVNNNKHENSISQNSLQESNNSNLYVPKTEALKKYLFHGYNRTTKYIEISDEEFYRWMCEIYNNQDDFLGYTVSFKGVILKDADLKSNQFYAVRQIMTCCVADLTTFGPVCNYEHSDALEDDAWVTIEGTLIKVPNDDEIQIDVTSLSKATPPSILYINPYV